MKKLTNEEFLQRLKEKDIKYIPLEEYKGSMKKIKWLCNKDSTHIFEAKPNSIFDGHGCPYCGGYAAIKGANDLWTTHPEVAKMLVDSNIGYEKSYGSSYITDWICPDCGSIVKDKSIHDVVFYKLVCDNCANYISFPEKVMISFLNQLNSNYIHDKSTAWSNRKRYDFYIVDKNIIIECNGEQHYCNTNNKSFKDVEFQIQNDEDKKRLALLNGVEFYIQLDCRKSDFDYIQNSILNSELSILFDLTSFDWDKCNKNICLIKNNYYNDILNLVLSGVDSPKEISRILNIGESTALRYLKRLSKENISNYNEKTAIKNRVNKTKEKYSKQVKCVESGVVYASISEAARDVGAFPSAVSECCRKTHKKCRGFHWEYYKEVVV